MIQEDFNYEAFAKNLATQASELIPEDIDESGKVYIVNLVYEYCTLAGEALAKDPDIDLNLQQATIACQIIGEWTFHKAIDIIRSKLPIQVRDEILQKVAFTAFDILKISLTKNLPVEQVVAIVEHHVKRCFSEAIDELNKRGIINETMVQDAMSKSNLDDMSQANQQEDEAQKNVSQQEEQVQPTQQPSQPPTVNANGNKVFKLASVALLFKKLPKQKVQSLLKKFSKEDANMIIQYMGMPDLQTKFDNKIALKCLKEIKKNLPKETEIEPNKITNKIKKIVKNSSKEEISSIIKDERENIKDIIKKENQILNLPPKIATILFSYLEEKVRT